MIRILCSIVAAVIAYGIAHAQNHAVFGPFFVPAPECGSSQPPEDYQFRFICFDPSTGEYILRYPSGLGSEDQSETEQIEVRIELKNLGDPAIEFDVEKLTDGEGFRYWYVLENRAGAWRPVTSWAIVAAGDDDSVTLEHPSWRGHVGSRSPIADPGGMIHQPSATEGGPELKRNVFSGKFARWSASANGRPIEAGETASLFSATSNFRPGWTMAYVGAGQGLRIPHDLPPLVQEEVYVLQRPENNYSVVLTVGPKFSPTVSAQWIAVDWHLGVQKMIVHQQLSSDSPYLQELLLALRQLAQADNPYPLEVSAEPAAGLESVVDKAIRMALAPVE